MQNNFQINSEFNNLANKKYPFYNRQPLVQQNSDDLSDYNEIIEIQNKLIQMQNSTTSPLENNMQNGNGFETFANRRNALLSNRLSCDKLENLKERYVDFLNVNKGESLNQENDYDDGFSVAYADMASSVNTPAKPKFLQNKTSKSCAQLAQVYQRALYSSKYDLTSSEYLKLKPDPPQRTVSIRHSAHYTATPFGLNEVTLPEDDIYSMKSLYSSCIASSVASSSCSSNSSNGSGNYTTTPIRHCKSIASINEMDDMNNTFYRQSQPQPSVVEPTTERLIEMEIRKIQLMYQSINCSVHVGQSTVNFYTTHSEQIANLQDCWKLRLESVVPVWIYEKRQNKLKLIFVSKTTAFALCENIFITNGNKFKNPKEKHITFKIDSLICLIYFYDFHSCLNFFKFYIDILQTGNGSGGVLNSSNSENLKLKFIKKQQNERKLKSNDSSNPSLLKCASSTNVSKINKNFISSPCAFQHVNSIKNIDQQNVQRIVVKKT